MNKIRLIGREGEQESWIPDINLFRQKVGKQPSKHSPSRLCACFEREKGGDAIDRLKLLSLVKMVREASLKR